MNLNEIIQSKGFKSILAKIYSYGASIVVLGALFKIQHWPGAGFMLSTGLITEAIIFFFYAFETDDDPIPVYPVIVEDSEDEAQGRSLYNRKNHDVIGDGEGSLALAKFDEMLENAEITPDLFLQLGVGMKKLGETTANINSMGDVSAASTKYMKTIKTADESLEKLSKIYETTISKVTCKTAFKYKSIANSLAIIEEESRSYHQQMESLNKNISALNTVYKLQKKEADDYLKNLTESVTESQQYHKQMTELNDNLSALNKFYGNMRSAMKI